MAKYTSPRRSQPSFSRPELEIVLQGHPSDNLFATGIQAVCSFFIDHCNLMVARALREIKYYQSAAMDESVLIPQKRFNNVVRQIASCVKAQFDNDNAGVQGWQSVGSIRFPDPILTEISGIRSCSDPEINFNSWIGSGSFLVVPIIGRDRSKLKVYPEFIGHLNEMGSALIKLKIVSHFNKQPGRYRVNLALNGIGFRLKLRTTRRFKSRDRSQKILIPRSSGRIGAGI
jgi:hypothetical protein